MSNKINEELRKELCGLKTQKRIDDCLKLEQERADRSYAPMIIKTIVFTAIGVICLGFLSYLVKQVW